MRHMQNYKTSIKWQTKAKKTSLPLERAEQDYNDRAGITATANIYQLLPNERRLKVFDLTKDVNHGCKDELSDGDEGKT